MALPLFAEGSKDFYESAKSAGGHVQGNRTRLASMIGDGWAFNPYNTLGRHYVYAEAGEVIHMGSSSQGYGKGTSNNATVTITVNCAAGATQVKLTKDVLSNADLPQVGETLFFEDFGTSAAPTAANDYGRTTSPYMPAGSGTFGSIYRGFMNLPSTRSEQTSYHKAHDPDRRFYLYVKAGERITVLSGIEHNNRNTYEVEI